jgi:2-alkenal reductase
MKKIAVIVLAVAAAGAGSLATFTPSLWAQRERAVEPRQISPRGGLLAAPSVAYITTETRVRRGFFGEQEGVAQGSGSGFVWDSRGNIVTNHHVVANVVPGRDKVLVKLDNSRDAIPAEVIGTSPEYDLAVVRLSTIPANIKPLPIGVSRDLKVGQSVIAIGNPFGLSRTLTAGIISALDRYLPTEQYVEIAGGIQTDAAINPGNSGGPLLDSAGRLIGVNQQIRSASGSSAGVGFAIPVDTVNRVVPQLIARGYASYPSIGIQVIDPYLVARNGIKGVVISATVRGSPAAEANLKPLSRRTGELGDVIIAVNGRQTDTFSTFVAELDRVGVGNVAELTIVRDDKERRERIKVIDANRRSGPSV